MSRADGIEGDGEPDRDGSHGGCIEGAVRLGKAVTCHPTLPAMDCRGTLCVDLLLVASPSGPPLARSCRAGVDLSGGKHAAFSVTFSAVKAPPQTTILVGAFLAEEDPTSPPTDPSQGDPTLSVAVVSYASATHCPWVNLELDKRW